MWPVLANQNADSPVRTAPFPGMGVGCTTSYVEIRSLATMRIRSPRSYISRTLPLAIRGRSAAAVGGMGRRLAAAPDAAADAAGPADPGARAVVHPSVPMHEGARLRRYRRGWSSAS